MRVRNQHHRHHTAPKGHKFSIGAAEQDRLVGVVIVGRPVARHFDDGLTLEVTRAATLPANTEDGGQNAGSLLYAAAWRATKALGYRRLVTYTQKPTRRRMARDRPPSRPPWLEHPRPPTPIPRRRRDRAHPVGGPVVSITRISRHTCRECGRPLTDGTSRAFRIGPECRKDLSPEQLRAALQKATAEADPTHITPPRPATAQAQRTNTSARTVIRQAIRPDECEHGGMRGACPTCRHQEDPANASERIITEIRAERAKVRAREWAARIS